MVCVLVTGTHLTAKRALSLARVDRQSILRAPAAAAAPAAATAPAAAAPAVEAPLAPNLSPVTSIRGLPSLCSLPLAIMNDEPRAKRHRDLTTVEDFYRLGKEVQNRNGQKLCANVTEDRCFREYFGTSVHTDINAWNLLIEHDKLDEGSEVSHMLWAMYFLKCYPLTPEACTAAGVADAGAVDPKTWKKTSGP